MGVAHEVLFPDELEICCFLNDAADRLDDAHEFWLETQIYRLGEHLQCQIIVK